MSTGIATLHFLFGCLSPDLSVVFMAFNPLFNDKYCAIGYPERLGKRSGYPMAQAAKLNPKGRSKPAAPERAQQKERE
jgi:hypothetical protein